MEELPNAPSLPLARNELLIVSQRNQPSLAAEGAHLSNVIHIHHGVPMNPLKAGILKPVVKNFQRLSCLVLSFRGDNPHHVPFSLECVDLVGAQQEELFAYSSDDSFGSWPRSRFRHFLKMGQSVDGLPARNALGAFHCLN